MNPYEIRYTERTIRALEKLPTKKLKRQIRNRIDRLADGEAQGGTRVRGTSSNVFRMRSGDYRILYALSGSSRITILDIGHRRDVYRRMNP